MQFLTTFALLCANAFISDNPKILLFGIELTLFPIHHFETIPNSKKFKEAADDN